MEAPQVKTPTVLTETPNQGKYIASPGSKLRFGVGYGATQVKTPTVINGNPQPADKNGSSPEEKRLPLLYKSLHRGHNRLIPGAKTREGSSGKLGDTLVVVTRTQNVISKKKKKLESRRHTCQPRR